MQSKKLVIDASVARASGKPDSMHPSGQQCREFLGTVRSNKHRVVMTAEIKKEWDEHQSGFAQSWLVQMYGQKKIVQVEPVSYETVAKRFGKVQAASKEHQAMEKDWLLVGAALAADKTIISLDEAVRKLFKRSASVLKELQRLVWVNPTRAEENSIPWLKQGAKPERQRMLAADS